MFKVTTRKFIATVTTVAWLILTLLMIVVSVWFPVVNAELIQIVWGGFTGFVGLVVGFYFGKSTALETPYIVNEVVRAADKADKE